MKNCLNDLHLQALAPRPQGIGIRGESRGVKFPVILVIDQVLKASRRSAPCYNLGIPSNRGLG